MLILQAELCQENGYDGVYQLDEEPMDLQIVLTSEVAHILSRGTPGSIGYDLFAAQTKVIPKKKIERISTDIKIRPPQGYYAQVCSRSGMASKGITVIGGAIDPDYTGAIEIIIHNSTNTDYRVRIGEKIAQFILLKICIPEPTVVTELKDTERGEQGFGHTDNVQALSGLDEKLILKEIVQQTEVKILIDSGAGIDYISDKLVKEMGLLPSTMRNPLRTKVADGHVYEINQYLPALPVDIADFKETISL